MHIMVSTKIEKNVKNSPHPKRKLWDTGIMLCFMIMQSGR